MGLERTWPSLRAWILTAGLHLLLTACGSGGGGGDGGGAGSNQDTTAPTVAYTSPASGSSDASITAPVTAVFSEPLDPSSMTESTFVVSGGSTGTVTLSSGTARFMPYPAFAYGTTYTATLTTGVRDLAGNPLGSSYSWTFTTVPVQPGALDLSFNGSGKVVTTFGSGEEQGNAVLVQPDGKIVAAGVANGDFCLARYEADGSLDTSFSGDGKATSFFVGTSSYDVVNALVLQPDGRILAAGSSESTFAVARYHTDGSLDTTFDTDGKATVPGLIGYCNAIAIQPDGKILLGGTDGSTLLTLVRLQANGALDTTFDTDGIAKGYAGPGGNGVAAALAVQPDGKILAAGTGDGGTYMSLMRFHANGSLDTMFGSGGRVLANVAYSSALGQCVHLQADGRIVLAGTTGNTFGLYRYASDGTLETVFQSDSSHGREYLRGLAVQADGKFVAAGYRMTSSSIYGDFVLRRYGTDGSFDTTFGTAGRVTTAVGVGSADHDGGHAVAIQPDGRIVVVGTTYGGALGRDLIVARYWP